MSWNLGDAGVVLDMVLRPWALVSDIDAGATEGDGVVLAQMGCGDNVAVWWTEWGGDVAV